MKRNVWVPQVLVACSLFMVPGSATAGPRHHRPSSPSRPVMFEPGYHIPRIPRGAITLTFGGKRLFFYAGVFYEWRLGEYVVVTPPPGIMVPVLPMGYRMVSVAGNDYFVIGGVYYRRVRGGYLVVAEPSVKATPEKKDGSAAVKQPVTAWVHNPNGSRTPVALTPTDEGQWIGPKGEYYTEFPTEAQLKPVYGLPGGSEAAVEDAASETRTLWIGNTNGSKTPVELVRTADGKWRGPNSETYDALPTEAQLRAAYGLQNE